MHYMHVNMHAVTFDCYLVKNPANVRWAPLGADFFPLLVVLAPISAPEKAGLEVEEEEEEEDVVMGVGGGEALGVGGCFVLRSKGVEGKGVLVEVLDDITRSFAPSSLVLTMVMSASPLSASPSPFTLVAEDDKVKVEESILLCLDLDTSVAPSHSRLFTATVPEVRSADEPDAPLRT